jgi:YgiT-type zinc finger domain-containing protein
MVTLSQPADSSATPSPNLIMKLGTTPAGLHQVPDACLATVLEIWEDNPMLTPPSEFGRCPCGGRYSSRTVEVTMRVGGDTVLLKEVPQGACPQCGSRVYKADVLKELETLMGSWPTRAPTRFS